MSKEQLIAEHLLKPFEVEDYVDVVIPYSVKKTIKEKVGRKNVEKEIEEACTFSYRGIIKKIIDDEFAIFCSNYSQGFPSFVTIDFNTGYRYIKKEWCTQNTNIIGYNPDFKQKISTYTYNSILGELHQRIFRKKQYDFDNEINWNPYLIINNEKIYFQRNLEWELTDKQDLIQSIYNQISIGKIVLRKRDYKWVFEHKVNDTNIGFYEVIDGKQRYHTLVEFWKDEFPDYLGFYWKDYSESAQRKFLDYDLFSLSEISENETDEKVLELFIRINTAGKLISNAHLEHLKSKQCC